MLPTVLAAADVLKPRMFARKYCEALARLIGRPLRPADGLPVRFVIAAERKLKLRMPPALREYYLIAGRLPLNREHNRLYSPGRLRMLRGKLVFMEENQRVVFWGLDREDLRKADPEVFQVKNETSSPWYSEESRFSDWIIKVWNWQRGLSPSM